MWFDEVEFFGFGVSFSMVKILTFKRFEVIYFYVFKCLVLSSQVKFQDFKNFRSIFVGFKNFIIFLAITQCLVVNILVFNFQRPNL